MTIAAPAPPSATPAPVVVVPGPAAGAEGADTFTALLAGAAVTPMPEGSVMAEADSELELATPAEDDGAEATVAWLLQLLSLLPAVTPAQVAQLPLAADTRPVITATATNLSEQNADLVTAGIGHDAKVAAAAADADPGQLPADIQLQAQDQTVAVKVPVSDGVLPLPITIVAVPAATAPQAAPSQPPPVAPPTPLPLDGPEGVTALGEQIAWSLDQGLEEARIELHPAELGTLVVRIETRGDGAQVSLAAAEPATRMMLAQALPQLRELFSQQGMHLGRAQFDRDLLAGRPQSGEAEVSAPGRRRISRIALVDAYV